MKDRDQKPYINKPPILDRQKLDDAARAYSAFASRPEFITLIQAPQLEGTKRDKKY